LEKGCALLRSRHPLVKALALSLAVAGCGGRTFTLTGEQMAGAEQKSFDAIQKQAPDADTLFIAHEWQAGQCRHFWLRGDFCFTRARATPATPWTPLTAQVRRETDGSWTLLGANWPRR
jgi:hypothetical protein